MGRLRVRYRNIPFQVASGQQSAEKGVDRREPVARLLEMWVPRRRFSHEPDGKTARRAIDWSDMRQRAKRSLQTDPHQRRLAEIFEAWPSGDEKGRSVRGRRAIYLGPY